MTAIVDKAVWEKITRGRAGIRWDNVVEKIWKDLGGGQEEVLYIEKFDGYKTEVKQIMEERERQALRNKVKEIKHVEIYGGLREDIGMKTYLHGPMNYAKNLKLRCRVGDLDLPERIKIYIPAVGRRRTGLHICARVAQH